MVSPLLRQIYVMSAIFVNIVGYGYAIGFASVILPVLKKSDSEIPIDTNIASWFAAFIAVMLLPGYLIAALLLKKYGRKVTMLVAIVPNFVGFVLMYTSTNITSLMCARLFQGLGFGLGNGTSFLVISEVSSPQYRGVILNFIQIPMHLGYVISHSLGLLLEWRTIASLGVAIPVVAFVMVCFWPESPIWLANQGHFEKCEQNFYWYRGRGPSQKKELDEMLRTRTQKLFYQSHPRRTSVTFFRKLSNPGIIKPSLIVLFAYCFLEACGRHVFPSYAVDIISEFTGNKSTAFYYSLSIDSLIMLSIGCSCVLTKYFRRRFLIFTTGLISLFFLLCFCLYLFLKTLNVITADILWIPLGLFILYFISLNLGVIIILPPMFGEMFPIDLKEVGLAVNGTVKAFFAILTLKLTPLLLESIKLHGTMFIYSIFMSVSLLYLYFYLPETKDKTLQEIENVFVDRAVEKGHEGTLLSTSSVTNNSPR